MKQERWLRIIPVALIMYTISYVDRTNISLALDPNISKMMHDLLMDDRIKGQAAGIFFLGYVLLQVPGGHWASNWSPKKLISILLVMWGICAVGCGLTRTSGQFEVMRFFLGVAESAVFPATTVLLANWFPRAERARANGYWNLCQPLAVVGSAPITGKLLGLYGWQTMLILEGVLPFIWLPIWWFYISDHPKDAKWISPEEREFLESSLKREALEINPTGRISVWSSVLRWEVAVMVAVYFFHNCAAYGCMTFLTTGLKGQGFDALQYGVLFAIPYAVTAVFMFLNARHSDKTRERRGHAAAVYAMSGVCLIASVMLLEKNFWLSYVLLCFAIPGPFAAMAPFWSIPSETLPRNAVGMVVGIVNAVGNVGGFIGPSLTGWLKQETGTVVVPFSILGVGLLIAASLCFLLPVAKVMVPAPPKV
jgi:MFS family permease